MQYQKGIAWDFNPLSTRYEQKNIYNLQHKQDHIYGGVWFTLQNLGVSMQSDFFFLISLQFGV